MNHVTNAPLAPTPPPPPPSLYERRKQIYPKLAHGKFRMVKWVVMALTLGVYYVVPWIRWPRGEGIPDQAVLTVAARARLVRLYVSPDRVDRPLHLG